MKNNKKLVALVCCMLMLVGAAGATLAWLMDTTEPVKNTFSPSDINIELTETTGEDYQMIPGFTIDKDPVVTVKADSEDCWVFIKVNESNTLDDYIAYEIDGANWEKLEDGVYYCKVTGVTADRNIKVLGPGSYTDPMGTDDATDDMTINWSNNQVGVKPSVTKAMMDALEEADAVQPTLTFKAYAVQLMKSNDVEFTPAEAWETIPDAEK